MDIEQLEALAFGDRAAASATLIPGTADHDYWRGVHLQQAGKLDEVDALLDGWTRRHGHDELYARLGRRQLLLRAGADLAAHAEELRVAAGARLDDEAEVVAATQRRPTRLDPELIDGERLVREAVARRPDLAEVTAWALPALAAGPLDATQRRNLLARLDRANLPGLVALIAADLDEKSSPRFGALPVHGLLTLEQLDELARLRPALRAEVAWVGAVVARLAPAPHVDWAADLGARGDYLDRLWAFASSLAPSFNALKAVILYHRLELDRALGRFDRARLLAYLDLPRDVEYAARDWLQGVARATIVHPGATPPVAVPFEVTGDDEPLVRELLAHFLLEDEGHDFAARVRAEWLQQLLAETRLVQGDPDTERWAKILGPAALAELRDRVEITLTARNPPRHAAGDDVVLEVDVKNVRELTVKVFRINVVAYFLLRSGEVDATIDLDGMVASDERTIAVDLPAIRRKRLAIALEGCKRPGTYVVELIGNGRSSRAVVRKGELGHIVRVSAAGPSLLVLDEAGRPLPDARLWLGGREHAPRADGWITLPFSTRPGRVPVLLCHGDVARRVEIDHPAESYALAAGIMLEREQLVAGQRARILVRPALTVAGQPAPLALLEEARVEVSAADLEGTSTSKVEPAAVRDDAETAIDIFVPDGVTRIGVRLRGRVRVVSTQQIVELDDGAEADVNLIHRGDRTEALHLATTTAGHTLHLLGKTGEPCPARAVALTLRHRAVTRPVPVSLETDERGAIALGPLDGIDVVEAALPSGTRQAFTLAAPVDPPSLVHALAGAEVALPAPEVPADLALVELRGGAPARDAGGHVTVENRALVARGLEPGQYRLSCRGLSSDVILVIAPLQEVAAGWATAGSSLIELRPPPPLVRGLAVSGADLVLTLSSAGPATRVHLVGLRFRPDPALPRSLHRQPRRPDSSPRARAVSSYVSGRDIGDEMRYVLERRKAPRRPGTMLEKPWLLLNPWPLRATTTGHQISIMGGAYAAGMPQGFASGAAAPAPRPTIATAASEVGYPCLDFLPASAAVLANLRPDASGRVRVPLADLGAAQLVRAVIVDPELTRSVDLPLPPRALAPRDLRLRLALDPTRHFTEERRVEAAPAGSRLVVDDVRTGKLELVDTVARAHQLLLTLGGDGADTLREFSFLAAWQTLDEPTKRERYSKHACHELHLFLAAKDPPFFERVVRPYLAHRRDKTLVDLALLGEDVSRFLDPWAFGRLNTVEKILLGRCRPELRDAVARLIGDAVDLIPPDPERDARLIATLLGAAALERAPEPAASADEPFPAEEVAVERTRSSGKKRGARMAMAKSEAAAPAAMAAPAPPPMQPGFGGPGGGGAGEGYLAADLAEREEAEQLYRGADRTQEWAETSWYRRRIDEMGPGLIAPNRFWRDLARHREGPFLSPHLGDCTTSFADALCALAFLELPFAAAAHESAREETRLTVTTASHALAARTRIVEVEPPAPGAVLVGQSLFRGDDRWEWDGAEQRQKRVTGELLAGVVYGCQVVVTNPTPARRKLELLLQIPRGAIPVAGGFLTRTFPLDLAAYGTQSVDYSFYFPQEGRWSHFPAHARGGDELAWAAAPPELEVVLEPTTVDPGSWSHVSQEGTLDEVLAFLERANLGRVELGRIAWRMRERDAFERTTALLAARHVYDDRLWAYALLHGDRRRAGEWLRHQEELVRLAAPLLEDGLAALDPIARGWYQHLEYAPLINARAHQLGARRRILNDALDAQLRAFLELVAHRARPTGDDCLAGALYLVCMDRIDDAIPLLARVDRAAVATRLQHDYLAAYVACCRGDLAAARELVAPWVDHPVDRWRHRFAALAATLDEAAGARPDATIDGDSRTERMDQAAARQPALELTTEKGLIVLVHHNLRAARLRLYRMDIELLFSRQPFVQGDVDRFSFIDPGAELEVAFDGDGRTEVAVPPAFRGANMVVEALAPGLRRAVPHYAHDLSVQLSHAYGQVRVLRAASQAPLPAAYVKVYGRRSGGQVSFYKDGYTDLRGRFDYATLSTSDLESVERFALLVVSDEAGATVLEAAPPPR